MDGVCNYKDKTADLISFLLIQLLIGYECGLIVLWDMRAKCAELRWQFHEPLRSAAWHFEGKHFVTSHTDGSLCTWPLRSTGPPGKPQLHVFPHGTNFRSHNFDGCKNNAMRI